MGLFIITVLAVFDPEGLAKALIFVLPALCYILGFFTAPASIWGAAVIAPLGRLMIASLGTDPSFSGGLFEVTQTLATAAEVVSAVALAFFAVYCFVMGRTEGSMASVLLNAWRPTSASKSEEVGKKSAREVYGERYR